MMCKNSLDNKIHKDKYFFIELLSNCFFDNKEPLYVIVKSHYDIKMYYKEIKKLVPYFNMKIINDTYYSIIIHYIDNKIIKNKIIFIIEDDNELDLSNKIVFRKSI